jgi:hypothetical protein
MRQPMMAWCALGVAMLGMAMARPAQAWSELGHRMIGDLAEQRLSPAAREAVGELLAGESEPTLGGVAAWADALRHRDPARFRISSRWHYINARGGGCSFDEARDCAEGGCVVSAIKAQRRIVADRRQPREARRDALKFLVHFVGDLHQPLHAGPREDSGGNGFQVSLRRASERAGSAGRREAPSTGTNLHVVWDSHLLASAGLSRVAYVERLRDLPPGGAAGGEGAPPEAQADADLDVDADAPLHWARESCALVESRQIYPATRNIGADYLDAHRPLAEQRVRLAASRLAALLNATLAR